MLAMQRQLRLSIPEGVPGQNQALPRDPGHVYVPPIKMQGIKTKLVPFIMSSVRWNGQGRWIEPFVGSGVVLFNVAPAKAYATDTNVHVIRFYQDVASGVITPQIVRKFLDHDGRLLRNMGEEYYYEVRERFNAHPTSLDFLFLNRACFNGLIRFNRSGRFNVPFGKKVDRFRAAYVTKIVNQVSGLRKLMAQSDWTFEVADWKDTLRLAVEGDFVYGDPPYYGRHTDYYNKWSSTDESDLLERLRRLPCGFALSTWKENRYRQNPFLSIVYDDVIIRSQKHFYHVGATEDLRNEIEEALVIRKTVAVGADP